MLSSISWLQFISAVIIITFSYYVYVIGHYYQAELSRLFIKPKETANLFAGLQSEPFAVMGAAKLEIETAVAESHDLYFTETLPDEPELNVTDTTNDPGHSIPDSEATATANDPSQSIPDSDATAGLLKDIRKLSDASADIENKDHFLSLVRILINSRKRLNEVFDLSVISDYLIELPIGKLKFQITADDLQHINN